MATPRAHAEARSLCFSKAAAPGGWPGRGGRPRATPTPTFSTWRPMQGPCIPHPAGCACQQVGAPAGRLRLRLCGRRPP
eukprot:8947487-Pyramimonas_sp.AAC.1